MRNPIQITRDPKFLLNCTSEPMVKCIGDVHRIFIIHFAKLNGDRHANRLQVIVNLELAIFETQWRIQCKSSPSYYEFSYGDASVNPQAF